MDPETILKNAGEFEKVEYVGATYYRIGRSAVYFRDNRTAISGPESLVKDVLDRGDKVESREELNFADTSNQFVSIHIKTPEEIKRLGQNGLNGVAGKAIASATAGSITSSVRTISQMRFANLEDATEFEAEIRQRSQTALQKLKDVESNASFRRLPEHEQRDVRKAMNSISYEVSRSGDTVSVAVSFTPSKTMRKNGALFGIGSGQTRISRLAQHPGSLFSFPMQRFRVPSRVSKFEVTLGAFSGRGARKAAVRNALRSVGSVDTSRTRFNGDSVLLYSQRGRTVSRFIIATRLRTAGFRNVRVRFQGIE